MALQDWIRWLIPKNDRFYEMLERQAEIAHEAAGVLAGFTQGGAAAQSLLQAVLELEHQGDGVLHQLENELAQTFVTPIDREDLHRLSARLDDIVDWTKQTAQTYVLYDVAKPSEAMIQMMRLLVDSALKIRELVPLLRSHSYSKIIEESRAVFQLEKQADVIFRHAVGQLFHDASIDAKELLRVKEVLEDLEQAVNRCEGAADVLSNVAVKHG